MTLQTKSLLMRTTLIEFKRSIFDSNFYREIPSLSGKHVLKYICGFALTIGIITAVISAIGVYFFVGSEAEKTGAWVVSCIIGGLSLGVINAIMIIVGLLLGSLVFALVVILISVLLKRKVSYDSAYKYAVYAASLPAILVTLYGFFPGDYNYIRLIQFILAALIFTVNFKKTA